MGTTTIQKSSSLGSDKRPTVIDLFSGVGGLSLGAFRAGFRVVAAADVDPRMRASHQRNFPSVIHLDSDVSKLNGETLLSTAGIAAGSLTGLVGGPPCQGFSSIGLRRLDDHRNILFAHFFRLVAEVQPAFYLAENVPGILGDSYAQQLDEALAMVRDSYIQLPAMQLKASDYGAPTTRTRIFFVGYKAARFDKLNAQDFISRKNITEAINVEKALAGLPRKIQNDWQTEDQSWQKVSSHPIIRFNKHLKGNIPRGVGDTMAIRKLRKDNLVSGCFGTQHTSTVEQRFAGVAQGAIDKISRAHRLSNDGFCPTLRAGTGPERGSYQALRPIHPTEPRVITPREAARLQGFPDWFVFDSTKWHSFRQIGNSVSPILAEVILRVIATHLHMEGE